MSDRVREAKKKRARHDRTFVLLACFDMIVIESLPCLLLLLLAPGAPWPVLRVRGARVRVPGDAMDGC